VIIDPLKIGVGFFKKSNFGDLIVKIKNRDGQQLWRG
jgi:hypothetical protein